jgi:hypothetical protein
MKILSNVMLGRVITVGAFLAFLIAGSVAEAGRGGGHGGGGHGGGGHFGGGGGRVGGGHIGGGRVHVGGGHVSRGHTGGHVGVHRGSVGKSVRHSGVAKRYAYGGSPRGYSTYKGKHHRYAQDHKRDHDHKYDHKHRHYYPYYRYRYYSWYPYYSYGYYGGSCGWLYRNAVATNSPYWWARYYDCVA